MTSPKKASVLAHLDEVERSVAAAPARTGPARARFSKILGRWIEVLVLVLVAVSPWLFGGVEATQEWWLFSGVALGLVLWGVRVLVDGQLTWRPCQVVLCTLGLIYLGFWQLLPLPPNVLGVLSPSTQRTFHFLQPEKPETVHLDNGEFSSQPEATHTISFYRAATAQSICRLLAALSLFVLVRNNISAKTGLIHLSLVAFVNGVALSLLAIFQLFSSPASQIYWSYDAPVAVFGPFICRNHFPFYINCCIGLGVGLLVYSQTNKQGAASAHRNGKSDHHRSRGNSQYLNGAASKSASGNLIPVEALWLGSGLALMICAVLLSLSRGGVVVLFATGILAFLVWGRSLFRLSALTTSLIVGGAGVFALLSWFGFNLVKDRLETLRQTGGLEARTPLWNSCFPLMGDFPIFGTGYGTFQLVEPIHRAYVSEEFNQLTFVHAHNELIEAMVEGGIVRVLLTLAAIFLVFAAGYRVLRRSGSSSGLVGGALFAFATVVFHSLGDFGMHVPAITILVAVLAAFVMGIADESAEKHARMRGKPAPTVRVFRLGGIAPIGAFVVFVGVGLLLFAQSYHWQVVHRYMEAGLVRGPNADAAQQERRIEILKRAVALAPSYATTEMELAQAYYEAYGGQELRLGDLEDTDDVVSSILAFRLWDGSGTSLVAMAANTAPAAFRWQRYVEVREKEFDRSYLAPSLRYFIAARDLCPLLGKPHARLAAHHDLVAGGDPGEQYMERVRFLRKFDPEVWYISGLLDLAAHDPEKAWADWRRSLELSDGFATDIARRALRALTVEELMAKVLPDKPAQLYHIANDLFPVPAFKEDRKMPLINRALALLDQPGSLATSEEWRLKAHLLMEQNKPGEALTALKTAIQYDPGSVDLMIEYATLLHSVGFVQQARWELKAILVKDPSELKAISLLSQFDKAEAAGKPLRNN